MHKNLILANIIFIFHLSVVLFVLIAPFTNIPAILILHITFSICLFTHWYTNSNVCSLSVMESEFRGLDRTQTFSHKFIAPIYEISDSEWSNLIWIITFVVMCISIYYLYNSQAFQTAYKCYKKIDNLTFYKFYNCIKPLFVI